MNKSDRSNQQTHLWLLLYIVLFLVVCTVPLLGWIVGFESPNLEKRTLASAPLLLVGGRPNLEMTHEFDDYYADHFAFRPYLISGYHQLNQFLLAQSGNQKVISGKEGWLFFTETLPDYLATPVFTPAQLRRLATILTIQRDYLTDQGIDFHFTVAPNKNSIYGNFMPDRFKPVQPSSNLDLWLASPYAASVHNIDLLTPLRKAAADSAESLYHKTDSHWNNLGARIGYQTIMAGIASQASGLSYDDYRQVPYTVRTDWQGDLAVMLQPSGIRPDVQQYFAIAQTYRTLKPMRSLEDLLIQTSRIQVSSESGSGSTSNAVTGSNGNKTFKLLIFRDSFANALIPFLGNAFSSATFTREIPYNYTSINKETANVVLLEIVERNLPQLLQWAPILPAPVRELPDSAVQDALSGKASNTSSTQVSRLLAEQSGAWLKICGQLTDLPAALDSIGPVYLGLAEENGQFRYVEAFPVDETAKAGTTAVEGSIKKPSTESTVNGLKGKKLDTIGLTAYAKASTWMPGSQVVQVWFEQAGIWHQQEVEITLP